MMRCRGASVPHHARTQKGRRRKQYNHQAQSAVDIRLDSGQTLSPSGPSRLQNEETHVELVTPILPIGFHHPMVDQEIADLRIGPGVPDFIARCVVVFAHDSELGGWGKKAVEEGASV